MVDAAGAARIGQRNGLVRVGAGLGQRKHGGHAVIGQGGLVGDKRAQRPAGVVLAGPQPHDVGGAGLDVLIAEPPAKDNPLFTLPNVTLTPHSAGPTWENWVARFRNGFDNIERMAAGRKPLWIIPELIEPPK